MQKVIYSSEIPAYGEYIESSVIHYLSEGQFAPCESFDYYTILCFDWYDLQDPSAEPSQILIYFDRDDLFFLCENKNSYDVACQYFAAAEQNERALYLFFRNLFRGHIENLERIEDQLEALDLAVLSGQTDGELKEQIVRIRHELYRLKRYYDRFDSAFETFYENDNALVSEAGLSYFNTLHNRVLELCSDVQSMREYNNQIKDSYQSQIESEKNDIIKTFTMVTSIFMPLTLLVGWYGMNLQMPEFQWKYGYPIIIVVCLLICLIWYCIFKKKRWL